MTSEYGTLRSPLRREFARYVRTGRAVAPLPAATVLGDGGPARIDESRRTPQRQDVLRIELTQRQADVLKVNVRLEERLEAPVRRRRMAGCDGPIGHEQRVDEPVLFNLALKLLQRNERGEHISLLRPQREVAERRRAEDRPDGQPERAREIVLARVKRFDRNRRRTLDADHDRAVGRCPDLRGERAADEHTAGVRSLLARDVMKLPEPIVDAVDLDARRPSAARLIRDEARHDRDRSNVGERRRERRIRRGSRPPAPRGRTRTTRRSGPPDRAAAAPGREGCRGRNRPRAARRPAPPPRSRRRRQPRGSYASSGGGRPRPDGVRSLAAQPGFHQIETNREPRGERRCCG